MCFTYRGNPKGLLEFFATLRETVEEGESTYYPLFQVPMIRGDFDAPVYETREWGWLPANWKPSDKYKTRKKYQRERINARSEGIHTTWGFKQEFLAGQRCILIASAFHEPNGKGHPGSWFEFADEPMVGIAGIYARYEGEETIESCTMLTTDANQLVRENRSGRMRMPVVLDEERARQWLDPDRVEHGQFEEVFRPYDSQRMRLCDAN